VNNAMATVFSRFADLTPEEFRRVTEVTYLGTVYGTMTALKRMVPRDQGVIVQVGSALAFRSIPLQSAYCGSKHAVKGFTESLRTELMHDRSRVRVTMVELPAVNTPQFDWSRSKLGDPQPIPPIYQPEIAADAIVWATEHPRREIQVGAPTVAAINANKFFPGLVDRYLAATGFESQQVDEERRPDRPDNLWEPADEERDFGARGRFDEQSNDSSPHLWMTRHRRAIGVVAASLAAALLLKRKS
jgi:short-subunit dehydrogenase